MAKPIANVGTPVHSQTLFWLAIVQRIKLIDGHQGLLLETGLVGQKHHRLIIFNPHLNPGGAGVQLSPGLNQVHPGGLYI